MTSAPVWSISLLLARALVLVSGAAVLVIETLAARLVAPYVGLTLESHTAAIGIALLGIAAGAHLGGRLADRIAPRHVVGASLLAGGLLVLLVRPIIHAAGPQMPPGPASAVLLIAFSTLAPVTALSMVSVAVVRARLSSIEGSGRVVGSLSALGTIGALAGTFITGFVFVATLPTGAILIVTALVTILLGAIVSVGSMAGRIGAGLLAVPLAGLLVVVDGPCDVETAYYCARVQVDAAREGGRILWLDDLLHSYVDLDDPTHLEFMYTQRFADAIDTVFPPRRVLSAVHIGGGAFTMPRYIAVTRPGSTSTVLEIDRSVVALGRARLGVGSIPDVRVVIGDARTSLRRVADDSADVVVGDAFGGRSVPWHLATREFTSDIRRVLKRDGVYVLNVIDNDPNAFLRAEVATVARVFRHVAVVAPSEQLRDGGGGNFVVVASDAPIDLERLRARAEARGERDAVMAGAPLDALVRGARVLTDEFAPVDQLLTPYRYAG